MFRRSLGRSVGNDGRDNMGNVNKKAVGVKISKFGVVDVGIISGREKVWGDRRPRVQNHDHICHRRWCGRSAIRRPARVSGYGAGSRLSRELQLQRWRCRDGECLPAVAGDAGTGGKGQENIVSVCVPGGEQQGNGAESAGAIGVGGVDGVKYLDVSAKFELQGVKIGGHR